MRFGLNAAVFLFLTLGCAAKQASPAASPNQEASRMGAEWLRLMEDRLVSAVKLTVTVKTEILGYQKAGPFHDRITLEATGRGMFRIEGARRRYRCDGKTLWITPDDAKRYRAWPDVRNQQVRTLALGPALYLANWSPGPNWSRKGPKDRPVFGTRLNKATVVGTESIASRKAVRVDYTWDSGVKADGVPLSPIRASVWIDAKRLVPIKREVVEIEGDRTVTHLETFTRVDLDSAIGLDRFRIPQ